MNRNIVYAGIDVDDVRSHGCGLDPRTCEVLDFHCRPTLKRWRWHPGIETRSRR